MGRMSLFGWARDDPNNPNCCCVTEDRTDSTPVPFFSSADVKRVEDHPKTLTAEMVRRENIDCLKIFEKHRQLEVLCRRLLAMIDHPLFSEVRDIEPFADLLSSISSIIPFYIIKL